MPDREQPAQLSDTEKEAIKFLDRDFNQAFQQMRHYDAQTFDILKFTFLGYTTLIGFSLGLYQFGLKENHVFTLPIVSILSVGLIFGLLLLAIATRNRVYFVQVARYINEQRGHFFRFKPTGFLNVSKMYTDPTQPPFFHWRSSQVFYLYLLAALNGVLGGAILFITLQMKTPTLLLLLASLTLFSIQIVILILYLDSRERKSAEAAVFGKEDSPFKEYGQ